MVVWSEEASQRRDLKHPDVRVATLDLRKKQIYQSRTSCYTYSWHVGANGHTRKPLGRSRGRCFNTHMPFVILRA